MRRLYNTPAGGGTSVLLATTNAAKVERLRWLLEGLPLTLLGPDRVIPRPQVEESGSTHQANAALKAQAWSQAAGGLAIASDGGLVIPVLGSRWDSRETQRFAGAHADDRRRLERLLELLQPYRGQARRALWVEAVAVAQDGGLLSSWQAQGGEGLLAESYEPQHVVPGFWVATLWYFPRFGKRYVEMSPEELAQAADPWAQLKPLVQAFFRGR
ncbi:MAG: non-canonical purine NTP pyrophosphatase [Dehalococcoidia bacterium]